MKFADVMEIIEGINKTFGFMVHFEHAGDGFLRSDYFPDKHKGEKLIETEKKAWDLAKRFAAKTRGKCVNIYVVDQSFAPVKGYKNKEIRNR